MNPRLALAGLLLFWTPRVALTGTLPAVEAELRIESPLFRTGLAADAAGVENELSAWLAGELGKPLSYVAWTPRGASPPPVFGLVAALVDVPNTACGTRVELVFRSRSAQQVADFPAEGRHALFDECDIDIPTREAQRLAAELREVIGDLLARQEFRQRIEQNLLAHVPLATSVPLAGQTILVPFGPSELRAALDTGFRVMFEADNGAGEPATGRIEMRLLRPTVGGSVCRVDLFSFPSFTIPSTQLAGPVEQHPRFAEILGAGRLRSAKVFMTHYRQALVSDETVAGGLRTEP